VKPALSRGWTLDTTGARAVQEELRKRVVRGDRLGPVRHVAGVDVSYDRGSPILYSAVVVLDAATREVVEIQGVRERALFPYIPGYLSFRELPSVEKCFAKLRTRPDLVICDGQGLAHPRRFGLACHLGVLFDLPAIGCAKSPLIGDFQMPSERRGSHRRIVHQGETIGEVVRTRDGVKPVYVSIGHRVSLLTARKWVLRLSTPYRLPVTTRAAHQEVNRMRRLARKTREK
jgi:deoxyribonuclease V